MKPSDIKPGGNRSDKYSINLYRFVRKNSWLRGVFASQWSQWDGSFVEFDRENVRLSEVYIGCRDDDGWLTGASLSSILCGGSGYLQAACFMPSKNNTFYSNMIETTDWFWPEYQRIGRSLWDLQGKLHMLDDDDRWAYVGATRRDNWSGRWQKRQIVKEQKTHRHEVWG